MATDVERLIVRLEATQRTFERQLARANQTANRRARSIERRFQRMNKTLNAQFVGLGRGLMAAFAGGASIRGAQQLLDASTRIENALKVAGLAGEELTRVYDKLFESAQRNAAPIETLVELYSRASLVQKELGVSTEELLGFTDKVAMALRVAGTDAQSASGALLQLSQALGSGVVRAEEFNSILEGALPIAQAAAAGLEEAGGSVAKLRQLVVDGAVSSEAFFRAFEAGSVILEQKVASAELTVSQGFVRLQNVLIDAAGRFDDGSDASRRLAEALDDLADYIQNVDFSPATNSLLDFIDQVGWGIGKLGEFRQAIYDAARAFSEWTGGAAIGDALRDAGLPMVRGDTSGRAQQAIQDRIDAAFGKPGAGTQGRVTPTPPGPTGIAKPRTVSLSDYGPPPGGGGGGGGGRRGGGGGRSRGDSWQREIEQIRERTEAIRAMTAAQAGINPLVEDYGFAVEKAAAMVELETAAKRAGIQITPALKEQIEQLAASYAQAAADAERLAQSQDKARQLAEDFRSLGNDVMSGFIQDLRNGVDASEALANALGKVADKLLEIALNSLFSGGGGGLLGGAIIPGILHKGGVAGRDGYGHGRKVSPLAFANAPRMHEGGIAGLRPGEVPAILQRGEVVLPRGTQMGGSQQIVINAPINAPGADAAQLARVEESVKELARNIPRMVDKRVDTRNTRKTRPA